MITPRQKDCALLLSEGASSKEIAKNLKLSPRTVDTYIDNLKKKLQAKNRMHLISILSKMDLK